MDHVDLRRREERRKSPQGLEGPHDRSERVPSPLRLAIASSPLILLFFMLLVGPPFTGPPAATLLIALAAVAIILPILLLLSGNKARRSMRTSRRSGAELGGEKQLLLALRELGSLTPVEAALETSLTVDEADNILTRFAERGHLAVQSRDGVLVYTLPGGRPTPETRTV